MDCYYIVCGECNRSLYTDLAVRLLEAVVKNDKMTGFSVTYFLSDWWKDPNVPEIRAQVKVIRGRSIRYLRWSMECR